MESCARVRTMKERSMFPYRRGNKKRTKSNPVARRHRDGSGRRPPGSVHELLPLLQPTTKALAQMLAGNTRASGQLAHARNILAQAERLVEERAVDRLIPAHREEFLEQVARLKLTVADADAAMEHEHGETGAPAARPAAQLAPERLRALALSLASTGPEPETASGPAPAAREEDEPRVGIAAPLPATEEPTTDPGDEGGGPAGTPRAARLRLKPRPRPAEGGPDSKAPVG